jgi:hypothetical protein
MKNHTMLSVVVLVAVLTGCATTGTPVVTTNDGPEPVVEPVAITSDNSGPEPVIEPVATTNGSNGFDPGAIALTHNTFANGIMSNYDRFVWYKFSGESGKTYQIQWNSSSHGDGTKTCTNVYVTAFSESGSVFFVNTADGWASSPTISPGNKTVYILVTTTSNGGTYDIRYFDSAATPPQQGLAISKTVGGPTWISLTWNSIIATGYNLYRSTSEDGEYEKIATVTNTTYTDRAANEGTNFYKVSAYNSIGEGVTSKVVSTAYSTAEDITRGTSIDGRISAAGKNNWYKFTAEAGKTYELRWNDSYQGDKTKTVDIYVSGFRSDSSSIFSDQDSAWTTPRTISGVSGIVYLMVRASGTTTGTYAIEYTEK